MSYKNRTKQDVKSKKIFFGGEKSDGKKRKAGVELTFIDGEKTVLLNPSGRGEKYAKELKQNKRYTDDGKLKTGKDGKTPLELDCCSRAYRSGYLSALSDSAKAYNSTKSKKSSGGAK